MIRKGILPKKKKEIKVEAKDRICKNCVYSYLMQDSKVNPIVSECSKTKERFVASSPHIKDCGFKERKEEMVIHEMILLTK